MATYIIKRRLFSKTSKHKRVRVYDDKNPNNRAEITRDSSHDSGPGWSSSSSSESYSSSWSN